jgi:SAM-dependent methyltransferase
VVVVLEIGCGVARLGKEVAPHAREWWGVDVSANMVAIAHDRCRDLRNVRFFVSNGRDLSGVPTASVDKMYCHAVFIHMDKEDWYTYLVDARRVLKPFGLFYFDVWNLCDSVGWLRWQNERSLYRDRTERPAHRNQFSSPDELRTMVRMAGFELLQLVESFSLQAVVTHVPGGMDRAELLAEVERRHRRCYEVLRFNKGDVQSFRAALTQRLKERGLEPETRPDGSPLR